MSTARPETATDDPTDRSDEALARDLRDRLGGDLALPDVDRDYEEVWLPDAWLERALERVCALRDRRVPADVDRWSSKRRLVALLNRLDEDVPPVLAADDPRAELEAVYRGLRDLEREAEAAEAASVTA